MHHCDWLKGQQKISKLGLQIGCRGKHEVLHNFQVDGSAFFGLGKTQWT